jgi:16S rRNA C1402 N4-methylase RsmH
MKNLVHPPQNQIGFPFASPLPPLASLLLRKPLIADDMEVKRNPRARSAKLRAMEKAPELNLD